MIKDLAVHLTGSDEDKVRLAHAGALAERLEAHVTGLHVNRLPEVLGLTEAAGSAYLDALLREGEAQARKVDALLRPQMAALGVPHDLRRLDAFASEAGNALAREVRLSDLFIGTRPYGDPAAQSAVEEAVLFRSARPCLFLPPKHDAPARYDTVFVAWNDSRESARALADSLPLLELAKTVIVGLAEDGTPAEQRGEEPGADVGRYLSRHGIGAEIRMIEGWGDESAALLNEARRLGADLIVMGGYGHSRFREFVLGGATRHMLEHADVPVLMAH